MENYLLVIAGILVLVGGSSCYILQENGRQYHFHRTLRTWWRARRICEKEKGTLFIPDEPQEMTYVAELFGDTPDPLVAPFIGLNDIDMTGGELGYQIPGFVINYNGNPFVPHTAYVPNSGRINYCGVLRGIGADATEYRVEWEPCNSRHPFICERLYKPHGLLTITRPIRHGVKEIWGALFD